ncbi:zinc finger protein 862-like [Clytia hemisphaerica]|uniref:zinc finger protein 862-like n=1 Tax=Clytia hemisphaerica TaxID=252671 RepID=UPI0034D4317B
MNSNKPLAKERAKIERNMASQNFPKIKTLQKWKNDFSWLNVNHSQGMTCKLCVKWEKTIESSKNYSEAFVKGSKNYRKSAVAEHEKTTQHDKSKELEEEERCKASGAVYRKTVTQNTPVGAPIVKGLKKMSNTEKEGLLKLFQIAYLNAYKGRPYVDFTDWVEWAELNGIKFNVTAYKNRTQCTEFVNVISETIFEEDVKKKLKNSNFISVFCDGSTDSAVIEKECVYLMFVDLTEFEPTLSFIALKDVPSQDAAGIKSALTKAFDDVGMPELKDKIVFLASDGASVNSGIKTGLAAKFREDGLEWLVFVWCLSHRLELALKDSLDDVLAPVKKSLTNLFYLYQKSSKKLRELRKLHKVLKEMYEFADNCVKPAKATGTRWIAHVLRSMSGLVDKFGLYLQHFENVIADTSKQTDKATLEGKRRLLTEANVLLRCGLFIDLLNPALKFSLQSQKENFGIIELVDELDDMFLAYFLMKRRFEKNPETIFNLPNLQKVFANIKEDQDEKGKTVYKYQDITIQYYKREIDSIKHNTTKYIDLILEALKERFAALSDENDGDDVTGTPIAGDAILYDVCRVVDSRKWILPEKMTITIESVDFMLKNNIESLSNIFGHFEKILKKTSPNISLEKVTDEYISLVMYTMKHFNHQIHTPIKVWQFLNPYKDDRGWSNIFLIAELCFCAPSSNASLERFFSQMRIVKTDWRNSLTESNLTSLLRIKVSGPTLKVFIDRYCEKAVSKWYNDKDRRLNQKPRKKYRKRKSNKPPRKEFQLPSLFETSSESEGEQEVENDEEVTIL